jgi:hypothetical protein
MLEQLEKMDDGTHSEDAFIDASGQQEEDGDEMWFFQATAGLPEEILITILLELRPSDRAPLSSVCKTWQSLVKKSWQTPWGSVATDLGFHVLVPGRILRQAIPHIAWTVPDFAKFPRGTTLISPTFTLKETDAIMGRPVQWRLHLHRAAAGKGIAPESELDDLAVDVEAVNPAALPDQPSTFSLFCRIDNPASYTWGHSEMKKVELQREKPSVRALAHIHSVIADANKGFLSPSDNDSVTILLSILPDSHEYVSIFSLDDCAANDGADLIKPSKRTPVAIMPRNWNNGTQASQQSLLMQEYTKLRPDAASHAMQFWRVVMRRNNTFRPVSPEIKSYEEPFYAVFAHEVKDLHREKACLFIKYYDGHRLRFHEQLFIDRNETFVDVLRRLDRPTSEYTLFEEVHARRVDPISDLSRSLQSVDIGDGDVVVLVAHRHAAHVVPHYQKIVYTSPLVTVSPNMWHS